MSWGRDGWLELLASYSHSSSGTVKAETIFQARHLNFLLTHEFSRCTVECAASKVLFAKHLFWIQTKVFVSVGCRFPSARRYCQRHQVARNHCQKVFSGFSSPAMFHLRLKLTRCHASGRTALHCQDMLWRCSTTSQQLSTQCHSCPLPWLLWITRASSLRRTQMWVNHQQIAFIILS